MIGIASTLKYTQAIKEHTFEAGARISRSVFDRCLEYQFSVAASFILLAESTLNTQVRTCSTYCSMQNVVFVRQDMIE